ncbi:uncharacterized protein SPSK_09380 [Sporothrix schenckii 1099-18]|uniref:Uncharacterized protein n=2 Tax=Sporothrix schenckii TaxID=29908 RepID=U7PVT0_SPOS1|nr:uncharacterized protein SPSK_09380 [Sporothrix schenckii 1099-18]ERS99702.1 hypothetical protein HMPREF1624_03065 [Sporothrix schenckii ATCC 58251]KJR85934.1 hypothetical protein SPSK_09380 [Sporothrix schenckii 1099-18]
MHRPSFRSALGRTTHSQLTTACYGASGARGPLSIETTAFFSSTPSQAVLKNVRGRQDRLAAAASEVSSLNDSNSNNASNTTNTTNNSRRGGAQLNNSAPRSRGPSYAAGRGGGNIINLRSLPRNSRGGPRFAASAPTPRVISNPAFQASAGGENLLRDREGFGRGRGQGQGQGRGRGRGRGRSGQGRSDENGEEVQGDEKDTDPLAPEIIEHLAREKMGEFSDFEPRLTLEGLLGYRPAVVSTEGDGAGTVAMALREMRVMSGGDAFGGSEEEGASSMTSVPNVQSLRERLHNGETVFFDTAMERSMVEKALRSSRVQKRLANKKLPPDTPLVAPLSEAAKEVIVDAAIRGAYDTDTAKNGTLLQTLHRYQGKDYTYTEQHKRQFDAKILELLPDAGDKVAKTAKA